MEKPTLGLALSGGTAKSIAHIGVLEALTEAGIYPDYIAGTSGGAIVGSLYA
ncbi:MAG: patatin-like phospholipase family protein, partial [Candidatus Eisenbacteria bacterium]|nr:patatin-like phospholipase family protein [Candidatus Eisenbacteria bacterium]